MVHLAKTQIMSDKIESLKKANELESQKIEIALRVTSYMENQIVDERLPYDMLMSVRRLIDTILDEEF